MNKTLLVLRHEFIQMVTRKGFIIMAVLFPLLGLLAIGVAQVVGSAGTGTEAEQVIPRIGYVDMAGDFIGDGSEYENLEFIPFPSEQQANEALIAGDVDEYFIVPGNYLETGLVTRYLTGRELEISGEKYNAIRSLLLDSLLSDSASAEITERVKNPLGIQNIRLDEATGEPATEQGGFEAFVFPMVFGFLLIITIMSTSGYLLQGLGEEKENRVMEILLSSVSPRQLLIGKVLGLGSAGLLQIIFWIISFMVIFQLAASTFGGFFDQVQIPDNVVIMGVVYYVLGYLFFAVCMAGVGAITSTAKEGSQLAVIFILPAILPFYITMFLIESNPDHVVIQILSFIPVTAPMSIFIRMGTSDIATWEYAVSISILLMSIVGAVWLSAKLFRVFLLMYGKTPSLKEIVRLLRQS